MSVKKILKNDICVVGHPYAPIGMGEHVRSVFRALKKAGTVAQVVDIYGMYSDPDISFRKDIEENISGNLSEGINLFCINGDEVEGSFKHLKNRGIGKGYNIIYPAWELEKYPEEWAKYLNLFDEIWAPSEFIKKAIEDSVSKPVIHMPLACEITDKTLTTRRHFGVPESSYAFLFAFDFLSYMERKNPTAVIKAFLELCERQPDQDMVLVIKTNNGSKEKKKLAELEKLIEPIKHQVILIDRTLSDADMKALIYLCDCFVSLHRSEGFGRGLTEAMRLGKPVIATSYSGNMDFCSDDTCVLVDYNLVDLEPGDYPFWEGQVWADPSISHAVDQMEKLVLNPELGYEYGKKARIEMMSHYSYSAIGLLYKNRINDIT